MKQKIQKTIRIFGLASFLNDLGSDIIYPIWPLFVTGFLGANMAMLGFIDGLGDVIVSLAQAFSGYLSDRIKKRKFFIWLGYLFGACSRFGYAISSVWFHLIPFRILDRAGKIRSAPRDAIIADISTKENRCKNFGFLRAMDNFGAVCGIIISILFFELLGYKNLFLLAAIPSLIGALLIFLFIKEKKTEDIKEESRNISTEGFRPLLKNLNKNLKLFFLLNSFFALGSFSYSFLLIYATKFDFKPGFVPVFYLIFTGVAALVSLPFGHLADKIGRKSVLMFSYILWALVCISFIYIHTPVSIILTFILYGLHKGALDPVQKTIVAELATTEHRASFLGFFQMIIGMCSLPASFIAGILWEKISIFAPFYFSIGLTILAIITLMFVKENQALLIKS